jgi:hypothetical protein
VSENVPKPPISTLRNNKFSELKVFNHLAEENNETQTTKSVSLNPVAGDLPKNSTPIFTDSTTAALLLNKRKQLLNAKLDLTIAPPALLPMQGAGAKSSQMERKSSSQFLLAPRPATSLAASKQLATVFDETIQLSGSGALNVSKMYSIENATSTNLVSVAKTDMPRDLKKCFKDEIKEIKKDKSKCSIQ